MSAQEDYIQSVAQHWSGRVAAETANAGVAFEGQEEILHVFKETLKVALTNLEERLAAYAEEYTTFLQDAKPNSTGFREMLNHMVIMENYAMQQFRQRRYALKKAVDISGKEFPCFLVHRVALQGCRAQLVNDLNLHGTTLLDSLIAGGILNDWERDSIIGKSTPKARNEDFFRLINGRLTEKQMKDILIPALGIDHKWLAEELEKELELATESTARFRCHPCKAKDTVELKRVADNLLKNKVIEDPLHADLRNSNIPNVTKWEILLKHMDIRDHVHLISALEEEYPDLHQDFRSLGIISLNCCCQIIFGDHIDLGLSEQNFHLSQLDEELDIAQMSDLVSCLPSATLDLNYNMDASPRGTCLIINNVNFRNYPNKNPYMNLPRRTASVLDVSRLEAVFKKFDFKVRVLSDLTHVEMIRSVTNISQEDHSEAAAFVCCVGSHGEQGCIYDINGQKVAISDLTSPFKARSCPTLAGKPKLFFFHAGQGKHLDCGADVVQTSGDRQEAVTIPNEADFLLAHCTTPGYLPLRDTDRTAIYITALANVLEKHGEDHDLLSCLLMVNNEVSKYTGNTSLIGKVKQVPYPKFTLRKRIFLGGNPDNLSSTNT